MRGHRSGNNFFHEMSHKLTDSDISIPSEKFEFELPALLEAEVQTNSTALRAAAFSPQDDQVRFLIGTKDRSLIIYEAPAGEGVNQIFE